MHNITNIYEKFLKENHRFEKIKAGGSEGVIPATETSKSQLINNLLIQNKFNNILILVIMAMFIVIFGIGIYFSLYYRNDPKTMGVVFGGSFLSLLVIIRGLQNLWKQKSTMDMLLTIVPNMTPDKAVEIIEMLYYANKKKSV